MSEKEKVVAIVCPWDRLPLLAQKKFRAETLPDKNVMVWRDDLQTQEALAAELDNLGISAVELRTGRPTDWRDSE